eukprot:Seg6512.1 transcript_id=Seg6512.1/GoldUCD/mRNA.D3Y31 product="BTB/POZ domain-containing adapter for CUL3-mediated RhoA degradation protein 1" protein_id=Seg6512.1/GoldUCD/D3Y31
MDDSESGDDTAREEMLGDAKDLLPGQIKLVMLNSNGQPQEMLTSVSTLSKAHFTSQLYKISSKVNERKDSRGVFYIDREADNFHHILNYLRYQKIPDEVNNDEGFRQQLLAEARYYNIDGLIRQIGGGTDSGMALLVGSPRDIYDLLDGEVKLMVGGTSFKTTISTLKKAPYQSVLYVIGDKYQDSEEKRGIHCIDRSPEYFNFVLEYLRNDTVPIEEARGSSQFREALLKEARYYYLPDMASKISETNAN